VLARVFLFFTLLPLIEIGLLFWLATRTPAMFVLALVVGTAVIGILLARHQGLQTLRRISADVDAGRVPGDALVDGLLVLVAAVLLFMPGLLTDVVAIGLLFPPTRRALKGFVRERLKARVTTARFTQFHAGGDEIIDVKVLDSPPSNLPG
jgi:UPF0716 protein FxsA